MAATVKFVSLTPYCLVEYIMEPLGSSNILSIPFYTTKRGDILQVYNEESQVYVTRNTKGITTMPLDGGKLVFLDIEKVPNYTDYDTTVSETLLHGFSPVIDRVRIHFATGFNFVEAPSLVFSIKQKMTDARECLFANIILDQITSQYLLTFNPKPVYLRDAQYDRYVEIVIPSIKNIDEEFYDLAPNLRSSTFEYAITDGVGFVKNNPISIALDECTVSTPIVTGITSYQTYNSNQHYETDIVQVNEFDDLGVVIQEAAVGDYIEFYATWSGGFPDELIATLNDRTNEKWIIIHQLTVFEQVGSAFIQTANTVQYQTNNFASPQKFRPILEYAHEAISMTIDYTIRLLNQNTGDQIIRSGSMILLNPNKYGPHLLSIQLRDAPESQHVYNKIVKKNFDSNLVFIEQDNIPVKTIKSVQYVPVFYEAQNIVVTEESHMISLKNKHDVIAFGQGKLPMIIQPFDNILKFKVYTRTIRPHLPDLIQPMNLNLNSHISLIFNTQQGQIKIDNSQDHTKAKPGNGEILFKVTKDQATKILASSNNNFHLVSTAGDGTQTSFYSGKWYSVDDRDKVTSAYEKEKSNASIIADLQSQITELQDQLIHLKAVEHYKPPHTLVIKKEFNPDNKFNFQTSLNLKLAKEVVISPTQSKAASDQISQAINFGSELIAGNKTPLDYKIAKSQ